MVVEVVAEAVAEVDAEIDAVVDGAVDDDGKVRRLPGRRWPDQRLAMARWFGDRGGAFQRKRSRGKDCNRCCSSCVEIAGFVG